MHTRPRFFVPSERLDTFNCHPLHSASLTRIFIGETQGSNPCLPGSWVSVQLTEPPRLPDNDKRIIIQTLHQINRGIVIHCYQFHYNLLHIGGLLWPCSLECQILTSSWTVTFVGVASIPGVNTCGMEIGAPAQPGAFPTGTPGTLVFFPHQRPLRMR